LIYLNAQASYDCDCVAMRTYKELFDLAVTCAKQAHITTSKDVAHELWRMAVGYQQQAAQLDGGKLRGNAGAPSTRR
jgi:hypothetical protein